jgi:hypothetical protein
VDVEDRVEPGDLEQFLNPGREAGHAHPAAGVDATGHPGDEGVDAGAVDVSNAGEIDDHEVPMAIEKIADGLMEGGLRSTDDEVALECDHRDGSPFSYCDLHERGDDLTDPREREIPEWMGDNERPFEEESPMRRCLSLWTIVAVSIGAAALGQTPTTTMMTRSDVAPAWMSDAASQLAPELVAKYGQAQASRVERGIRQAGEFWRTGDGDETEFKEMVRSGFAGDQKTLDALFDRMEFALESFDGHMLEISRDFRRESDLDRGPIYPFDEILAGYDPSAHANDDLFQNRLAFTVLLNFPLTTLEERLTEGPKWSRRQWAEARLGQRFSKRIPADVNLAIARASGEAAQYIAQYNIWMHHLVDAGGARIFPAGLRLLSHWNLRDEIKADYSDPATGPAKQRVIEKVMERIVTETIPGDVVDNPNVDWNPFTNAVTRTTVHDAPAGQGRPAPEQPTSAPEPDRRYAVLLDVFRASKLADPYSPTAPTLMARRFDENREIPEKRVEAMLVRVLSSPLVPRVATLIRERLGRPLEPFDIWYNGFRPRGAYTEAQLDAVVRKRYPTADAYKKDMPNLFRQLGFSTETAQYLADNILVDPARGSGHALGASRREDHPHLRTRVGPEGMDYKGFNIAVHEMGHTVEQTFSLNRIDHTLLAGVPNTAFTEALAFVFQNKDLELLGLSKPSAESESLKTLNDFWGTYEISGVALVDMAAWHWMYDHPDATPAQLREAVVAISKDVWNRYYAPVFGKRDVVLLGVYSHMIDSFLYLPDYPIGHMIAFQIEAQMEKAGNIGQEFERMAREGSVAPDVWMIHATGAPVGPDALLAATEKAVKERVKDEE